MTRQSTFTAVTTGGALKKAAAIANVNVNYVRHCRWDWDAVVSPAETVAAKSRYAPNRPLGATTHAEVLTVAETESETETETYVVAAPNLLPDFDLVTSSPATATSPPVKPPLSPPRDGLVMDSDATLRRDGRPCHAPPAPTPALG